MRRMLAAILASTAFLAANPAGANPGERVDFLGTVVSISRTTMQVQQAQSGGVWTVSVGDRGDSSWRERYVHSFQVGQQIHVTGMQTDGTRIRADDAVASATSDPNYQPGYQAQPGYDPNYQPPQPGQPGYQSGQPGYNPNYPQAQQPGYQPQPGQPGYDPNYQQSQQQGYQPQPGQPGYDPNYQQNQQQGYQPLPGQPGYNPNYQDPNAQQPTYTPVQPGYQPQPGQPGYQDPNYQQQPTYTPAQPGYQTNAQQPTYTPVQPGYQPQPGQPGYQDPGYQQPGYTPAQQGYQPAGQQPAFIPPGGLYVANPPPGAYVPQVFNVQGQSAPFARIQIRVKPQDSTLIPGVISVRSQRWEVLGQADPSGHFDVAVDISRVAPGSFLRLTVVAISTDGSQSQPIGLDAHRQP